MSLSATKEDSHGPQLHCAARETFCNFVCTTREVICNPPSAAKVKMTDIKELMYHYSEQKACSHVTDHRNCSVTSCPTCDSIVGLSFYMQPKSLTSGEVVEQRGEKNSKFIHRLAASVSDNLKGESIIMKEETDVKKEPVLLEDVSSLHSSVCPGSTCEHQAGVHGQVADVAYSRTKNDTEKDIYERVDSLEPDSDLSSSLVAPKLSNNNSRFHFLDPCLRSFEPKLSNCGMDRNVSDVTPKTRKSPCLGFPVSNISTSRGPPVADEGACKLELISKCIQSAGETIGPSHSPASFYQASNLVPSFFSQTLNNPAMVTQLSRYFAQSKFQPGSNFADTASDDTEEYSLDTVMCQTDCNMDRAGVNKEEYSLDTVISKTGSNLNNGASDTTDTVKFQQEDENIYLDTDTSLDFKFNANDTLMSKTFNDLDKNSLLSVFCSQFQSTNTNKKELRGRNPRSKPHACPVCKKMFRKPCDVRIHMNVHTGQLPYVCGVCRKGFYKPEILKTHQKVHEERTLKCDYCDKAFYQTGALKRHIMTHTKERPHHCSWCGKGCVSMADLVKHERIHTGEKPYVCDVCGKTFTCDSHLIRHKVIHTGAKPYLCPFCGRGFAQSDNMKSHTRIHTGERPYKCTKCDADFAYSSDLRLHYMRHTGEKKHTCQVCSQSFVSIGSLNRHCATHTGEKKYECGHCEKSFITGGHLKRHLKTHQKKLKKEMTVNTGVAESQSVEANQL